MVAIVQKHERGFARWAIGLLIAFVVVAGALFLISGFIDNSNNPKGASASLPTPSATAEEETTATTAAVVEQCAPEFAQLALNRNGSAAVNPNFKAELAAVEATGVTDPYQSTLLVTGGHNASLLALYAHQMGIYADSTVVAPLVDGDCLSQEGQNLYHQLDGAYHMKGVTFTLGQAPETGTNSGVDANGVYGIDAAQGVRGDRTAIEITLPDGSKTWVMLRCGNPVFQGRPNLPTVPTDNPAPPAPPTTVTPPPYIPPYVPPVVPPTDDSKDDAVSVAAPAGTVPLPAGVPTTETISEDQHEAEEVIGNIIDAPVATDVPDVTTPDIPAAVVPVTAPEATPNVATPTQPVEVITDDVVHEEVINNDVGGITGDTEIATPAD